MVKGFKGLISRVIIKKQGIIFYRQHLPIEVVYWFRGTIGFSAFYVSLKYVFGKKPSWAPPIINLLNGRPTERKFELIWEEIEKEEEKIKACIMKNLEAKPATN